MKKIITGIKPFTLKKTFLHRIDAGKNSQDEAQEKCFKHRLQRQKELPSRIEVVTGVPFVLLP